MLQRSTRQLLLANAWGLLVLLVLPGSVPLKHGLVGWDTDPPVLQLTATLSTPTDGLPALPPIQAEPTAGPLALSIVIPVLPVPPACLPKHL